MRRIVAITAAFLAIVLAASAKPSTSGIKKVKDVVVYCDSMYYSAFPSVVKLDDGRLMVAFRRAPNRQMMGANRYRHIDPCSQLVSVTSSDGGDTWTTEPQLMFAHPFGGSQDPCMIKLHNGDILCTSYLWVQLGEGLLEEYKGRVVGDDNSSFAGGFLIRSTDEGKTWHGPLNPGSPLPVENRLTVLGKMPLYNRGALCQAQDGTIYWAVACDNPQGGFSVYLVESKDNGSTWQYRSTIADDPKISFNETSIIQTPKGDLVAFMRSFDFDDHACIARSTDGGKSFTWNDMGFQGHPLNALKLPDGRRLLTYGFRHEPYGIRARIMDSECQSWSDEIVLRDDGGSTDLGYSWPVLIDDHHALVVYYFNYEGIKGTRCIEGTIVSF
ncbi:MAG: exo-alpha-sialidase [Muribaculaceae bacterium]|nr:exo-alpha-sialidase [Muribaculaceae bacterium]